MKDSWIKIHRKLADSPIMQHDGLLRLWIYCLLTANWKDSKWLMPGTTREIAVPRGSFITGRHKLHSKLYGESFRGEKRSIPSELTVWRWLVHLSDMGCITVTNMNNRCSMVSICNYSTYQKRKPDQCTTGEQPMNNRRTTDEQLMNTIEEGKNIRREEGKEIKPMSPSGDVDAGIRFPEFFEQFWNMYPKRDGKRRGKRKAFNIWKTIPAADRNLVIKAAKNYQTEEYIRDPERFLASDWWRDWVEPADSNESPLVAPDDFNYLAHQGMEGKL